MLPLNYHHLFYFWTTAKVGGIGAASRRLHLAQPTLSLQLKQLERSIGRRLLERGRRGVALTAEGRIAFDYCERIFSQGDELAAALDPARSPRQTLLRVGVGGPVSRHVVLQLLDHAHAEDPEVRIRLLGGQASELAERLARHQLDLVVSSVDLSPALGVEFRGRLAGSVPVDLFAKPALAKKVRRFPADLSAVPMLLMAPENPVRKDVDVYLNRHGVSVSVDVELEDAEMLRRLALRGQGAAALDALTAREDVAAGRLVRLHPRTLGIRQQVWFSRGRHPKPNKALENVLSAVMDGFTVRLTASERPGPR